MFLYTTLFAIVISHIADVVQIFSVVNPCTRRLVPATQPIGRPFRSHFLHPVTGGISGLFALLIASLRNKVVTENPAGFSDALMHTYRYVKHGLYKSDLLILFVPCSPGKCCILLLQYP